MKQKNLNDILSNFKQKLHLYYEGETGVIVEQIW